MKTKFLLILFLLPLTFLLVACSGKTQPKQVTKTSSITVDKLLDKMSDANEKLTSMDMEVQFKSYKEESSPYYSQDMTASLIYEKKTTDLSKGHAKIEKKQDGQTSFEEIIMSGGRDYPVYTRESKDGSWKKVNDETGDGSYYIQPDYFELSEILAKMADDFRVEEKSNEYVLTLESQNTDLMGLFKEQFNLKLTNVSQSELDKGLKVTVDKDSFYIKKFELGFKYDGQKGKLKLLVDLNYSSWNKVDESSISEPSDI